MTSKERDNNSLMKYVEVLHPKLDLIRQLARENIVEAQLQYKIQLDKKVKDIFEVGSKVLLFTPHNRLGTNFKVTLRFSGPYLVTSRVGPHNYTLSDCQPLKARGIVHAERLKMFYEGTPNLDNLKHFCELNRQTNK